MEVTTLIRRRAETSGLWGTLTLLPLAIVGCDGAIATTDGGRSGTDAPGPDVPWLDAPGADAPGLDALVVGSDTGPIGPGTCDPLPAPTGPTIRLGPADEAMLAARVSGAASGTTILLEDGTYHVATGDEATSRLIFRNASVTLRSVSGDASSVIIDGEYLVNELLYVVASDVTIADVTVTHAVDHLVHIVTEGAADVRRVRLHGLRLVDGGEQFVKENPGGGGGFVDDGVVECSFFQLTDAGRPHIERTPGGCYTGGIDMHQARGWHVHHNRFEDIYCAGEGLAEHAIHYWVGSRDTLVENNTIVNCARGIGFGLVDSGTSRSYPDDPAPGLFVGHYDGTIRNNVIFADIPYFDTGIELDQARGARVFFNTVVSSDAATGFFSSIDYRFANTRVELRNNLVRRITERDGGMATRGTNLETTDLGLFADVAALDLHLAAGAAAAIDQGEVIAGGGLDMDDETRDAGAAPDLGADER